MTRPPASRRSVLALVGTAQYMVVLDTFIVNVALPSIQQTLELGEGMLQWVINAYLLAFGGCLLLCGRCCDLFGRRRVLVLGLSLFTGASLLCGLAPTAGALIAARALQGLGAAMVTPAVTAILIATFADGPERGRAMAVFAGIAGLGAASGALVGGVITTVLDWRWIFLVNVPIGLGVLVAAFLVVRLDRPAPRTAVLDVTGALTVTTGLTALCLAIVQAGSDGWTSTGACAGAAGAAALLVVFVVGQARGVAPLVPLDVFADRVTRMANILMLLTAGVAGGAVLVVALWLQQVRGYSPFEAGLATLPYPLAGACGNFLAVRLVTRHGYRRPVVAGLAALAAGALLLALAVTGRHVAVLVLALALLGLGFSLAGVALFLGGASGDRDERAGLVGGMINTTQRVGTALGVAVVTSVAAAASDLQNGFRAALLVLAVAAVGTSVLAAAGLPARQVRAPVP